MEKSKRRHLVCAGSFLALGVAALVFGGKIPRGTLSHPGPGFFPFWLAIILIALSGFLVWRILRVRAEENDAIGPSGSQIFLVMAAFYAYALSMDYAGFELATLGLMAFLLWLFGSGGVAIVVISLLASGISAYLFGYLLRVPVPLKFFPLS